MKNPYERFLAFWVRRAIAKGVLWQVNQPPEPDRWGGTSYPVNGPWDKSAGWRPLFSIRHGTTPVYVLRRKP